MLLPDHALCTVTVQLTLTRQQKSYQKLRFNQHDSAKAFGIEPRVAMISYSTGTSGKGADVDKVKEATV